MTPGLPREAEGHILEALVAHFGWEPLAPIQKVTTQALEAFLGTFGVRGELSLALGILQDLDGLCSFLEEQQAWRQEALARLRAALAHPEALDGALELLHRRGSEVLLSEVLPNTVPSLLVLATLNAAGAILAEASLSFVGLGVQPPEASWGTLLFQGYQRIYQTLWYPFFPGAVIFLAIWLLTLLADQLQSVLDPRGQQPARA